MHSLGRVLFWPTFFCFITKVAILLMQTTVSLGEEVPSTAQACDCHRACACGSQDVPQWIPDDQHAAVCGGDRQREAMAGGCYTMASEPAFF